MGRLRGRPGGRPVVVVPLPPGAAPHAVVPGQLGLSRAYVAGEIDVEGDIFATFAALSSAGRACRARPVPAAPGRDRLRPGADRRPAGRAGARARAAAGGERRRRPRPAAHQAAATPRRSHTTTTSATTSTASCSGPRWSTPAPSGTRRRRTTERWTSRRRRSSTWSAASWACSRACACSTSAAAGAAWPCTRPSGTAPTVVGVTLSTEQAALARKRVAAAGLTDRVEIRVQDYREVDDGPFDAISSVGMAEHVGRTRSPATSPGCTGCCARAAGCCTTPSPGTPPSAAGPRLFIARYVFPDGELISLATMVGALEAAGSKCSTSRRCAGTTRYPARLGAAWRTHWDQAVRPPARAAPGCGGSTWPPGSGLRGRAAGVNQVLVQRPGGEEPPLRRTGWM